MYVCVCMYMCVYMYVCVHMCIYMYMTCNQFKCETPTTACGSAGHAMSDICICTIIPPLLSGMKCIACVYYLCCGFILLHMVKLYPAALSHIPYPLRPPLPMHIKPHIPPSQCTPPYTFIPLLIPVHAHKTPTHKSQLHNNRQQDMGALYSKETLWRLS